MTLAPAAYLTLRSPNSILAVTRPTIPAPSRVNIVPKLGQHRITDVTPSDLQSLVNEWSTRLAPRTVSRAYGVARALFAHGVACDLISRSHCRGAKLPRVDVTSRRAPTPVEIARLAGARQRRYRPMVYLGAIIGLRFSEVAVPGWAGSTSWSARSPFAKRSLAMLRAALSSGHPS